VQSPHREAPSQSVLRARAWLHGQWAARERALQSRMGNRIALQTNVLYAMYGPLCRALHTLTRESGASESARASSTALIRDGYCAFAPFRPLDELDRIARDVDRAFERSDVLRYPDIGTSRLRNSLERFPEILGFLSDEIVACIEAYFGSYFKVFSTDIYRVEAISRAPSGAQLWHVDNAPPAMLKAMVYLDDTTPENGPLRVKHKSVSQELVRAGFWDRHRIEPFRPALEDPASTHVFTGALGTCVLFESHRCIHRGTPLRHGHRDVAAFLIVPSLLPWRSDLARNRGRLSQNFGYCVNPFTSRPLRVGDD
jgi:hypothetical protein